MSFSYLRQISVDVNIAKILFEHFNSFLGYFSSNDIAFTYFLKIFVKLSYFVTIFENTTFFLDVASPILYFETSVMKFPQTDFV